jgi:hypothetical protein
MQISTLRPGLLVSLKTSVRGNVSYNAREIEADHFEEDGSRRAVWETTRTIERPEEHEAAVKVRSKARGLVTGVCAPSDFGLLCPEASRDRLTAAVEKARELITAFNAKAALNQVELFVIIGRVAADDIEAIRAINSEVRDLLAAMETGLKALDVKAVRAAANKARAISQMLSPEAATRAKKAIELARDAARRVVKAGETAGYEVDKATLRSLRRTRSAFIDLDNDNDAEPAAPTFSGRAIEFEKGDIPPAIEAARPPRVPSIQL